VGVEGRGEGEGGAQRGGGRGAGFQEEHRVEGLLDVGDFVAEGGDAAGGGELHEVVFSGRVGWVRGGRWVGLGVVGDRVLQRAGGKGRQREAGGRGLTDEIISWNDFMVESTSARVET